jgi:thiamine biosynthesis lipoprotein
MWRFWNNLRGSTLLVVLVAAWVGTLARAGEPPLARFEFSEVHMAVDFVITLYAPDEPAAKRTAAAAFARIKQLDEMMSDYRPQSELSRLSDTAPSAKPVPVSDDLWRVLTRANAISDQTGGAFDCTVGPLVKLWRRARRTGELPSDEAIASAREAVGYRFLELDPKQHAVRLLKPKMRLDLGGIAKGYASDAALAVLKEQGITRALVAGSGDIAIGDPPPGKRGWRIGIGPLELKGPPSRHVLLANAGISTSGDSMQHVVIGGKRFSHVINPATGSALTDHCSVTVIAPDCTTTDGLSTGVSVMGPKAGLDLVEKTSGVAAYIVRQPEGKVETFQSSRFRQFDYDRGEQLENAIK